jgi:NitT/TauT family transport system ATP-binding protein
MAGLIEPTSGSCEFAADKSVRKGYMLQHDHLFGWRSILKNATLGLEIQKNDSKENIEYVKHLLRTYGLGDFMNSYPHQLSGGMRQRAALIRTLALKPDIMLLDEPFSALDYQTRLSVGNDIAGIIFKEKKTAVLITHDLTEAIGFADRVIVMTRRPGKVKNIYAIDLECESRSRIDRQICPGFAKYHETLWKDLDLDE